MSPGPAYVLAGIRHAWGPAPRPRRPFPFFWQAPPRPPAPLPAHPLAAPASGAEGFRLAIDRLEIAAGTVTALVGPNGAGKSTLLALLALLAAPDAGELRLFGAAVTARNREGQRGRVSLLMQHPYLFRTTVATNVAWALEGVSEGGSPLSPVRRRARVAEALEAVDLGPLARRPARTLSGGEGQRLALARLLARAPDVLLLDEPTSHVDAAHRARIEALLKTRAEAGATVVVATHDRAQAARLGARLVALAAGRITDPGAPGVP